MESDIDFSEAKNAFFDRQKNHNTSVRDILDKLSVKFPKHDSELDLRGRNHDSDKLKDPLLIPYVYMSAMYKDKALTIDDEMKNRIAQAKFDHVKTNPHHPEFWDKSLIENPFKVHGRFAKSKVINASKMDDDSILEMVADWTAMGIEMGDSARSWADKVIKKRFDFTSQQIELIYKAIKSLEG